ncbi:hypothetical protein BC332_19137 [Capsicum chinense]|nr:hypothetical protein BC332_19137 [Capsicum chinense]
MPKRVKIGPKTVDCMFIGYAESSKVCRFLIYKSEHPDINENTVIESDNAELFENIYSYKVRNDQSSGGSKRPRDEPSENVHNEENSRRSIRQRTSTSFGSDFVTFFLENEPQTFKEVMASLDSSFWKEAVNRYSDANWITGSNEVKSTSGYVFTIGGGAVSWKSSKQTYIARSTMESEFIALDKAGEEAAWLQNFLEDIPYWPKPVAPVYIYCDSQAAIGRAGSMMYNGKSRHIRRRHNTVRELLSSGIIIVDYVKSKDNVLDPLTKSLSREGVERTSKGMGLRPRTSQRGGFRTKISELKHSSCLKNILCDHSKRSVSSKIFQLFEVAILSELQGSERASDKLLMLYYPFLGFAVLPILRGLLPHSGKTISIGKRSAIGRKKRA